MRYILQCGFAFLFANLTGTASLRAQTNKFPAQGGVTITEAAVGDMSNSLYITWGNIRYESVRPTIYLYNQAGYLAGYDGAYRIGVADRGVFYLQDITKKRYILEHDTRDGSFALGTATRLGVSAIRTNDGLFYLWDATKGHNVLEYNRQPGLFTFGDATRPTTGGYAAVLDVAGAANNNGGTPGYVARFSNAGGEGSGVLIKAGSDSPRTLQRLLSLETFNTARFAFFGDGRTFGLSDARMKTNVTPVNGALSRLKDVRGVTFNWKEGGETQMGLIAQEVEAAFPELVTEADGLKGVDYGRFTAVLVQAIKELHGEVETLRASNEELRKQLVEMRNR